MSKLLNMIGFLKTTAIGGLLFLLPLIVIGALIGQVVPVVLTVAEALGDVIPVKTPGGIAMLVLFAVVIVLLLCFGAGLLARRSIGKRVSERFEKGLLMLFPRYAILKDQMAGSIGGDESKPQMKPVLVKYDDLMRMGFEIERSDEGLVTVYLPGSPDPWSGSVVFLRAERVQRADIKFGEAVGLLEQLGRGSTSVIAGKNNESS